MRIILNNAIHVDIPAITPSVLRFSYKKQQSCAIFVELPISAVYRGAAHRNIKICYGALHLQIMVSPFFATNIAVRCTFKFYKKTLRLV
jgi:hypothetical protein